MKIIGDLLENRVLILSLFSLVLAQVLKIFSYYFIDRKLDLRRALASGGMPSSHSSFVSTLMIAIGFKEGFASSSFAIATVFALIIMYDAAGVRQAVGTQAKVINQLRDMIDVLVAEDLAAEQKLKELVGHTKLEVMAGSILGILVAIIGKGYVLG